MAEQVEILPPTRSTRGDPNEIYNAKLNPSLPQLPFMVAIVGPRNSGKTNLLRNLLSKRKGMYGAVFRPINIILYKPTLAVDYSLDELKIMNSFGRETNCRIMVKELIDMQQKLKDADNALPILLVLDDITQILEAWSILLEQGYIGRHIGVQILYISHKLSSIPRGVRTQTQQWILFKPHEQSEFNWVLDTFAAPISKPVWIRALKRVWDVPFQFVYIDFERKQGDVYHAGFDSPLFTPEEVYAIDNFLKIPGIEPEIKFQGDGESDDDAVETH